LVESLTMWRSPSETEDWTTVARAPAGEEEGAGARPQPAAAARAGTRANAAGLASVAVLEGMRTIIGASAAD